MDFDVLPGPPLAELARTAMARACAAVVSCAGPGGLQAATVPVRVSREGHPILLPRRGSALARQLAAGPAMVTVTVPADAPFYALRLAGMAAPPAWGGPAGGGPAWGGPAWDDPAWGGHRGVGTSGAGPEAGGGAGLEAGSGPGPEASGGLSPEAGGGPGREAGGEPAAYPVTPQSLEFTGATSAPVLLTQYEAAVPDPFRYQAPAVLRHLEDWHMAELVRCVRMNGIETAECVVPRGLDRFGLELLVFTPGGLSAVRLAFPDGPVAGIEQVPASIRAVFTCRCGGRPG